jgi:hypothetical protein
MNKQIRTKIEKRRALAIDADSAGQSAEELQHAFEAFRASTGHLVETVWVELHVSAAALLQTVRAKSKGLSAQLTGNSDPALRRRADEARRHRATGALFERRAD